MPTNRHWTVFADDTGDPGLSGTKHFGYAAVAVERLSMARLIQLAADFRVRNNMYVEAKVQFNHPHFREVVDDLAKGCEETALFSAACLIVKERYEGPYLRPAPGRPADPHFLRNFNVRHLLENLFQGETFTDKDTIKVVLDRVDYSDAQIMNLRDYLSGELAREGAFLFPRPRWITHADSAYVEGLQVANHVAELAYCLEIGDADAQAVACASRFLRMKTLVRSREVTVDPSAESAYGRKARRRLAAERGE